ncbi:MAG TPA: hypothetical protein VFQ79_09195 [Bryobacteraceae bacterium]|nr:hypothetical protein [Bryobacteraceae bacterium]
MTSRWRNYAAPIIRRVLADTAGRPEAEVRAALRAAYPFGPRRNHPYKIWLDEIAAQTGRQRRKRRHPSDPQQTFLSFL